MKELWAWAELAIHSLPVPFSPLPHLFSKPFFFVFPIKLPVTVILFKDCIWSLLKVKQLLIIKKFNKCPDKWKDTYQ